MKIRNRSSKARETQNARQNRRQNELRIETRERRKERKKDRREEKKKYRRKETEIRSKFAVTNSKGTRNTFVTDNLKYVYSQMKQKMTA